MNLDFFIARRLLFGDKGNTVSVPIVKIALVGIALGVCVMLLSIFVIMGFKKEITNKITGFSSHLNIVAYGNNNYYSPEKIMITDSLIKEVEKISGIKNVYPYVNKPAILKQGNEIHGVILYGIDSTYIKDFFRESMQEGDFPDYRTETTSNDILVSSTVADILKAGLNDRIRAHFVQEPPRERAFTIKGIYNTGFKEYDEMFVICDIRHLQRLNDWQGDEVSGLAVELYDITSLEQVQENIEDILPWDDGNEVFKVNNIYDIAPQLFDWLALLNTNVWVILILIVIVAGFNMVSGLLILILDKTSMIGILKALGYRNINLRKLFLYISMGLIGRGMLWGNILALVLGGLQYKFHIIRLDPASYYMDTVPLSFNIFYILLLNIGVLFVSTLMLIIPTMLISRIKPIKAIRFE